MFKSRVVAECDLLEGRNFFFRVVAECDLLEGRNFFFRVVEECDLLEGTFFLSFFLFLFYDILGIEVCSSLFRV